MERRLVSELNNEELKRVFEENQQLRYDVEQDYIESEMDYIQEILDCFKDSLVNWEIGFYTHSYVKVGIGSEIEFAHGLIEATDGYDFLSDEDKAKAEKLLEDASTLNSSWHEEEEEKAIQDLVDEEREELEEIITKLFNNMTEIEEKYIEDYFIEFYADERMNSKEYFIDENYTLYSEEVVSRCYK